MTTYNITIGDKVVYTGLNEEEAKTKCCLMLGLSSRLDIFYNQEMVKNDN